MIYGERVRQIRELRKLTQTEVAHRLAVTQGLIAQIEGGRTKAPDRFIESFSLLTRFPVAFFTRPPDLDFPLGSLLFRANAAMTVQERNEMYRYAQVGFGVLRRLTEIRPIAERHQFHLPLGVTDGPVVAAQVTRSHLALAPDEPISNLMYTLERAGILVLALPRVFEHRDAFSLWAGFDRRRPVLALSAGKSMDRLRFNMSHELGHLVMHHPLATTVASVESEAHQFAGEFLLPEAAIREDVVPPFDLDLFLSLKSKWGVSMQALIMRARDLQIVSSRKASYLFQQLSARGWRINEPYSDRIPVERPRAIRQIAELIYGVPINLSKLAADTGLSETFLREFLAAYRGATEAASASKHRSVAAVSTFRAASPARRRKRTK